jgi:hypothetical protein
MGVNFNNFDGIAATTAAGVADPLPGLTRVIPPNRRVQIRNVSVHAFDGGVGGYASLTLTITNMVTGAVIATFRCGVLVPGAGTLTIDTGDRKIYFDSGPQGVTITGTSHTLNISTVDMSYSGFHA